MQFLIEIFQCFCCRSSKHFSEISTLELPSAQDRIVIMDEVRKLRLKSNKTPEEWRLYREISAILNAHSLPV